MTPLLSVHNLRLSFHNRHQTINALRNVSFDLSHNETVAIVGESGSGKSVMAKSLLQLLPKGSSKIEEGSVKFQGIELLTLKEKAIRAFRGRRIGFIFQDPMSSLNPTMKVGKQIEEALSDTPRTERRAMAIELLRSVGILEAQIRADQYPHELSGGMRQRVMIAIALAPSPDILIMDEPTTALDVTIQAEILRLIQSLKQTHKMAILFITHDLSLVASFCDRVLVMYGGEIVESGPVEVILKTPSHPYTQALLKSIPRLDIKQELYPIKGSPPDMRENHPGCTFSKRCRKMRSNCLSSHPELLPISPHQQVRCFYYDTPD